MDIERIAVFTGNLSYTVRKNIIIIDRAIPGLTWLILLHSPKKTLEQLLRGQWRNLRRHGWRRIPALALAVRERLSARKPAPAAAQAPGGEYTTAALRAGANVRILEVADIHAPEVLEEVRAFEPDLGLSLAAPILRHPLFALPRLGTVNLHKGKVPEYRGMPPAFWEMWNDEESVGCTVHWVEHKLDTGPIAAATLIDRERYSTVRGLQLRLDEVGIDLMRDVVVAVARGTPRYSPQAPGGKTYRQPTLAQEAELMRKIARRCPAEAPLPKRLLKDAIKGTSFAVGIRSLPRIAAPQATILLYHRVTDGVRDNLTVRRFPHDIRRGNPPISLMHWDHLRQLHESGFLIGSHTVNHIDCAAQPEEVVRAELEQSREDLYRQLGLQGVIFAYSYGGRRHMTPDRLELVKQAGYIGCVSAYGGSNVGTIDRFNALRRGIRWEFSDVSFLHESLGMW